ncbi:enoyl-CoA hydratase/isomerase family protein [Teichococcus oryzae]|uniref:Enoyl-CoA hydratase/isomerase family protein n=1 Tax=Teichococcus oryzae TaxID=1608942 RepID=A0A5B2THW5_9PROT|nr:enoyl-CoA hydratase-related protein [Pseudoroseomonas oryzae]KAA2214061.1 enoyl-CoA hydratase/isomerase family protein [Pseudoroseomonas oryzae]
MSDTTPADAPPTTHARFSDGVLELTLSYPRRRNALAMELREALIAHLERGLADPECRAIILTGEDGHFCAGGDISGMGRPTAMQGRRRMMSGHRMVRLLVEGEKPVIAAVEGHAAGAGISMAAACDIVVASREAVFTCSFNKVGLVPDLGAAWTVSRRIGLGRSKMLMMLGEPLSGEAAAGLGLVDQLAEPGKALEAARDMARRIAARSPLSNAMTKTLLNRTTGTLGESLQAEADIQGLLYASEDFVEGSSAFLEKRQPAFRGG